MEIHERKVEADANSERVIEATQHVTSRADVEAVKAVKNNQVVWYVVGLIDALLALRLLFHLFGARQVGFADFLYSLTDLFVAPFRGIFPAPSIEGAYFDTAALLAMIVFGLVGWAIAALIDISNPHSR